MASITSIFEALISMLESQLPQGKVRWVSFLLKRSLTVTRIDIRGACTGRRSLFDNRGACESQ
ncbi:hypothetical protein ABKV19_026125 [Rosa sericea]